MHRHIILIYNLYLYLLFLWFPEKYIPRIKTLFIFSLIIKLYHTVLLFSIKRNKIQGICAKEKNFLKNKPLQSWNVGDVTTLYQLRQSALYRCFTDVRASIQDFLFRDFSNLPSHHLLHPRRLPQHPVISFQKLPGKLSPNLADPCKIFSLIP